MRLATNISFVIFLNHLTDWSSHRPAGASLTFCLQYVKMAITWLTSFRCFHFLSLYYLCICCISVHYFSLLNLFLFNSFHSHPCKDNIDTSIAFSIIKVLIWKSERLCRFLAMRRSAPDTTAVKISMTWEREWAVEDLTLSGEGANNLPSTSKEGFLVDLEVFIFNLMWRVKMRFQELFLLRIWGLVRRFSLE